MINLYESKHFVLTDIKYQGKKHIGGILRFKGIASPIGSLQKILAVRDGIVTFAGRGDQGTRAARYGVHVVVMCDDGVEMIYADLDTRFVKAYDRVERGMLIGVQKDGCLTLELRRNGRRIDACAELGIKPETRRWKLFDEAAIVCPHCGAKMERKN